jgi:hypothetical protein
MDGPFLPIAVESGDGGRLAIGGRLGEHTMQDIFITGVGMSCSGGCSM